MLQANGVAVAKASLFYRFGSFGSYDFVDETAGSDSGG